MEKLKKDFYRPGYHFSIDGLGFPGDPNAMFFANGRFHMMFVYDRSHEDYAWGHVSTQDFVTWVRHSDPLIPDSLDGGIYSGGVLLENGIAHVAYWGLGKNGSFGGIRLAHSKDKDFERWEKDRDYAIKATGLGVIKKGTHGNYVEYLAAADPSNILKANGRYYLQLGNLCALNENRNNAFAPSRLKGDWTDVFSSKDLKKWTYLHRFYQRKTDNSWTGINDDNMCPVFCEIPTEENKRSGKFLELFLSHNVGTQYYIGDLDEKKMRFLPISFGRLSSVDNVFFAPEASSLPDGRLVMTGWLRDNIDDNLERERSLGWSGVHSLFVELSLDQEGSLQFKPLREYQRLRYNEQTFPISSLKTVDLVLDPTQAEIIIEAKETKPFGMRLDYGNGFRSEIILDGEKGELVLDTLFSGSLGRKARDFVSIKPRSNNMLDVFLDGPIIEVFGNGKMLLRRAFFPPDRPFGHHLTIFGNGQNCKITSYQMHSISVKEKKK